MEEGGQQDFVSMLLRNLRPDDPWVPPRTWEGIASESGGATAAAAAAAAASATDACQEAAEVHSGPLEVSEAVLVRLVLNALQGSKSALDDIEKMSAVFCSSSADRTFHQIPNLWHRSSSLNSLGSLLKSAGRSGLVFFFLRKFVGYFLAMEQNLKVRCQKKGTGNTNKVGNESVENDSMPPGQEIYKDESGASLPYTLVNQAFAGAVGKVLEGYHCALNTVFASVKCRHSLKITDKLKHISLNVSSLTSIPSEITLLEIYLHTKELRTRIEALGNICGLSIDDLSLSEVSGERSSVRIDLEFDSFPRGADLLTYLYVQLRDADPIHHSLLKFLFLHSCEPYCGFIRSWIYMAKIDDPYKEFIIEISEKLSHVHGASSNLAKERDYATVPCFLKHVYLPLFRAGLQLQVLVKLLGLCNSSVTGELNYGEVNFDLTSLGDFLPQWSDSSSGLGPCFYRLSFSNKDADATMKKRETMYRMMYDKLHFFFKSLNVRYQLINQMVMPFGQFSFYSDERENVDSEVSFVNDESLGLSPSSLGVGYVDTDASSASNGSSYDMDLKQTSEYSTFTSSESNSEAEECSSLHDISIEKNNFLASSVPLCYSIRSIPQTSCGMENSWNSAFTSLQKLAFISMKSVTSGSMKAVNSENECVKLNLFSDPVQPDSPTYAKITRISYEHTLFGIPWLLGGLSKNPFYTDRSEDQKQSLSTGTDGSMERFETEKLDTVKMYTLYNFKLEQSTTTANLYNGHVTSAKNFDCQPCNWQCKYDLSANPVRRKAASLCNFRYNRGSFLPYFDFSLVEEPYTVFSERLASHSDHRLQDPHDVPVNYILGVNEHTSSGVSAPEVDESSFDSAFPPSRESHTNKFLANFSENVSGGANWEGHFRYPADDVQTISGDTGRESSVTCDLPLDVVIDKFIVHEIIDQYVYVSNFTIKLLEEGFDLREHLLALRRYHFMEFADWADSYVVSLWNHKWSAIESINVATEAQRLLVVALQRSSCETDPYHERLYIYTKGQEAMPLSFAAIGTFDFLGLGYKVDWPISIIVTQDALSVYSEIFSFLLQVRLAVFSLSSVWHSLKALVHSIDSRLYLGWREMKDFNFFLKIRQQINHFISTLQQYLQSQLSDVSWCRFVLSLKHQVNDMLDLEAVHMSYLADAQNICFLSAETRHIAEIIRTILQCALDFRSCLTDSIPKAGLDGLDLSFPFGQINLSKAFTIKATFEKSMKKLYQCYLKSPKHSEFSLYRFWSYLDYNDYYSSDMIQGMHY